MSVEAWIFGKRGYRNLFVTCEDDRGVAQRVPKSLRDEFGELEKNLSERLIPGTALEGMWSSEDKIFYVSDITHRGMLEGQFNDIKSKEKNNEVALVMEEQGVLSRVKVAKRITAKKLPFMSKIERDRLLVLPPDDWQMQMLIEGPRLLMFKKPEPDFVSLDLRQVFFDSRMVMAAKVVDELAFPKALSVPTVNARFGEAYGKWIHDSIAVGVVMKSRAKRYPDKVPNEDWKANMFSWED